MNKQNTQLLSKPFFLLLLPVFFVLHGFIEYYILSLINVALQLILFYVAASIFFAALFWLFYKNYTKASLAAFSLMTFNLFFGSTHDTLKKYLINTVIVKYTFIIPFIFILSVAILIYLKKTNRTFLRTSKYLNCLFLVLIGIDSAVLIYKFSSNKNHRVADLSKEFVNCDTCPRPDLYLIIADEYPGNSTLKTVFSFDNSSFENQLKNRGFHIVSNSFSNYNHTYYSMASMLNMDYIKNPEGHTYNMRDVLISYDLIKTNNVLHFLKKIGYDIYNNSFFDFDDKQPAVPNNFYFTSKKELFTSQTFINRFRYDLGFHFASQRELQNITKLTFYNNLTIDSLTREIAVKKTAGPKLVYTHLAMPHHPYYLDSNGKEVPPEHLVDNYKFNKTAFIDYLLYTNKKLLELIDYIKKVSEKPPIVILMSDHGFRQFTDSAYNKFYFINLNSVYFPNGDYSGFYDGMSNVNQFRVLLNSQFDQKFSLLKDSSSFIWEK